jgi:glycerophosphoryl diester phosphodiesterase
VRERFGEAWDLLFQPPIAHRGLWSPEGPPENSLAAFEAACEAGYGIELDVQLTADGEAVVFHDGGLRRMTGADGRVQDRTAAELAQLRLAGSDERIPTLAEALRVIGRRAMPHIELKTPPGEVGPLEERVAEVIAYHRGPLCVIGFNPQSHGWFADHRPQVLRGLDSYSYRDATNLTEEQRAALADLRHIDIAKPHFLALGLDMLPSAPAAEFRARGMPVVAWTVRAPAEWEAVRDGCDNLIFEGFRP